MKTVVTLLAIAVLGLIIAFSVTMCTPEEPPEQPGLLDFLPLAPW